MAQRPPGSFRLRNRPFLIACAVAGVVLVVVVILAVSFMAPFGAGETRKAAPPPPAPAVAPTTTATIPPAVLPADPAALPQSTTYTALDGAPLDLGPLEPTDGTVVHPRQEIVVYTAPGGAPHTWPTADVFGTRSSDGCIRVPKDALNQLTRVPLGTLVLIDNA